MDEELQQKIRELLRGIPLSSLKEASCTLSMQYQERRELALTSLQKLAYLAVRLPATLAACQKALEPLASLPLRSALDLGSGPGTALLALRKFLPTKACVAIERDPEWIALGEKLHQATTLRGDFRTTSFPEADLVLFSYAYGEAEDEATLLRAWEAAKEVFALIEPGTPRGFATLLRVRSLLLEKGGHLLAPCPSGLPCPLAAGEKWCHFSVRLPRSALHRQIKEAELPYEDEKFCYLVVAKRPLPHPQARLLGDPELRKGHLYLPLCTEGRFEKRLLSRRDPLYKSARSLSWGDFI